MSTVSSASNLDQLEGLTGAKRVLLGLWSKPNGVHGLIFYGAPQSGKTTLARIAAKAWLCRKPSEAGACGECPACVSFEADANVDLLVIEPEGAGQMIKIGSIIEEVPNSPSAEPGIPLLRHFRTGPLSSRNKVAILEGVDRISPRAENALLKTLEEPHPNCKLILTTTAYSHLKETYKSRCLGVACEIPPSRWSAMRQDQSEALRESLSKLVDDTVGGMPFAALKRAETIRHLADSLKGEGELHGRIALAQVLESFAGELLCRGYADHAAYAVEAHRRILGNGNANFVTEALFTRYASLS
jgi:hypothetical protein